jgi:hypothetical protein
MTIIFIILQKICAKLVEFIRFHFSLKLSTKNRIKHIVKAPYVNIREHYQYIYPDERSSIILIKDNRTEKANSVQISPVRATNL